MRLLQCIFSLVFFTKKDLVPVSILLAKNIDSKDNMKKYNQTIPSIDQRFHKNKHTSRSTHHYQRQPRNQTGFFPSVAEQTAIHMLAMRTRLLQGHQQQRPQAGTTHQGQSSELSLIDTHVVHIECVQSSRVDSNKN